MHKKTWVVVVAALMILGFAIVQSCNRRQEENIVRVGVVLPLTGPTAGHGKDILSGIEMARNEIYASFMPDQPKLELIIEDDLSTPQGGVSALEKLIQTKRPPVVIGPVASSIMLAMVPIAEREKVVLFSPAASSPKISNSGKYIFRISLLAPSQALALAEYAKNRLRADKAAILYINNDTGLSYKTAFREAFQNVGGTIVFEGSYEKTAVDFRTQLTKLKQLRPQVIFIPGIPRTIGLILRQSKELGLETQFLGNYGAEGADLLTTGGDAVEGFVYASIPITDEFIESFKKEHGRHPTIGAPLGYDALRIVWEIATKQGTSSQSILKGLCTLKNYRGATGMTSLLSSGDAEKEVFLKTVQNGKFVTLR